MGAWASVYTWAEMASSSQNRTLQSYSTLFIAALCSATFAAQGLGSGQYGRGGGGGQRDSYWEGILTRMTTVYKKAGFLVATNYPMRVRETLQGDGRLSLSDPKASKTVTLQIYRKRNT